MILTALTFLFNQDAVTGEFVDASFASASTSDMEINGTVLTLTFRAGDEAIGSYNQQHKR